MEMTGWDLLQRRRRDGVNLGGGCRVATGPWLCKSLFQDKAKNLPWQMMSF